MAPARRRDRERGTPSSVVEPSDAGRALWKGMDTAPSSYPPMPPICLVLYLGIILGTTLCTDACNIMQPCWQRFEQARTAQRAGILKNFIPAGVMDSPECIVLRTHLACITNLSRAQGCTSNIHFQYAKSGLRSEMYKKHCTSNGTVYEPGIVEIPEIPIDELQCSFGGQREYRYCGLFGDPHLRTFSNEFQTCKVQGAWSLINNKHLTVQVTNDPVVNSGAATATSKLTVMIQRNEDECSADRFIMYAAQTDNLPGSFDDGTTTHGKDDSVKLTEIDPGKYVKIYLRYIDTTIFVRQIGKYLTFSIKIPQQVIEMSHISDSLELCVQGCPTNELIDYGKYLAQKKHEVLKVTPYPGGRAIEMTRADAIELCKKAKNVDFYFDSCVFDLITTGDRDFAASAFQARQDMLDLVPDAGHLQENRTDLSNYDHLSENAGHSLCVSHGNLMLTVLLASVFAWVISPS